MTQTATETITQIDTENVITVEDAEGANALPAGTVLIESDGAPVTVLANGSFTGLSADLIDESYEGFTAEEIFYPATVQNPEVLGEFVDAEVRHPLIGQTVKMLAPIGCFKEGDLVQVVEHHDDKEYPFLVTTDSIEHWRVPVRESEFAPLVEETPEEEPLAEWEKELLGLTTTETFDFTFEQAEGFEEFYKLMFGDADPTTDTLFQVGDEVRIAPNACARDEDGQMVLVNEAVRDKTGVVQEVRVWPGVSGLHYLVGQVDDAPEWLSQWIVEEHLAVSYAEGDRVPYDESFTVPKGSILLFDGKLEGFKLIHRA
jgi:hypothetical protein